VTITNWNPKSEPADRICLKEILGVILFYCLLALVAGAPFAFNPFGALIGDVNSDLWKHLWGFWWVGSSLLDQHQLPLATQLLNAPYGGNLYFIDPLNALLSIPIQVLGGRGVQGVVVSYNLLILWNLVLGGVGMYFLARRLSGSGPGALVAGTVYGLSPYVLCYVASGVTEALNIGYLPLYFLFLLGTVEGEGRLDWLWAGIFLFLTTFGCWYYGIFAILLTFTYLVWWLLVTAPEGETSLAFRAAQSWKSYRIDLVRDLEHILGPRAWRGALVALVTIVAILATTGVFFGRLNWVESRGSQPHVILNQGVPMGGFRSLAGVNYPLIITTALVFALKVGLILALGILLLPWWHPAGSRRDQLTRILDRWRYWKARLPWGRGLLAVILIGFFYQHILSLYAPSGHPPSWWWMTLEQAGAALSFAAAVGLLAALAWWGLVRIPRRGPSLLWSDWMACLWPRLFMMGLVFACLILPPLGLFQDSINSTTAMVRRVRQEPTMSVFLSRNLMNVAALSEYLTIGKLAATVSTQVDLLIRTVYVGFLPLVLGIMGWWVKKGGRRAFWLIIALLFAVFSLGPYLYVTPNYNLVSEPFWLYLAFFRYFPFFSLAAIPMRFSLLVIMALAVMGAAGVAALLNRAPSPRRWALGTLISVLILAEFLLISPAPYPLPASSPQIPTVYTWLANIPGQFSIIDLPMNRASFTLVPNEYNFYQLIHRRPIPYRMEGTLPVYAFNNRILKNLIYAEHLVFSPKQLVPLSAWQIRAAVSQLGRHGFRFILVHDNEMRPGAYQLIHGMLWKYLGAPRRFPGNIQVYAIGGWEGLPPGGDPVKKGPDLSKINLHNRGESDILFPQPSRGHQGISSGEQPTSGIEIDPATGAPIQIE